MQPQGYITNSVSVSVVVDVLEGGQYSVREERDTQDGEKEGQVDFPGGEHFGGEDGTGSAHASPAPWLCSYRNRPCL